MFFAHLNLYFESGSFYLIEAKVQRYHVNHEF